MATPATSASPSSTIPSSSSSIPNQSSPNQTTPSQRNFNLNETSIPKSNFQTPLYSAANTIPTFYPQNTQIQFQPNYPPTFPQYIPIQPANFPPPSMNQAVTVKLNFDKYLIWKNQLLNVIIANGMEGFINGTQQPPSHFLDMNQQHSNS
ncbi:hypothetical protein L484_012950 [Morus notabilis]|uniref:Retrotransposon Copia-like N-terminal domain-containing protein n=1 Tax=Morus notabilis TaxID=981085 RepID=W9S1E8_9ROSA|nr:hypothetical protein L484_012950 [Morus notabilis]